MWCRCFSIKWSDIGVPEVVAVDQDNVRRAIGGCPRRARISLSKRACQDDDKSPKEGAVQSIFLHWKVGS
jgi:hypothetical protein